MPDPLLKPKPLPPRPTILERVEYVLQWIPYLLAVRIEDKPALSGCLSGLQNGRQHGCRRVAALGIGTPAASALKSEKTFYCQIVIPMPIWQDSCDADHQRTCPRRVRPPICARCCQFGSVASLCPGSALAIVFRAAPNLPHSRCGQNRKRAHHHDF